MSHLLLLSFFTFMFSGTAYAQTIVAPTVTGIVADNENIIVSEEGVVSKEELEIQKFKQEIKEREEKILSSEEEIKKISNQLAEISEKKQTLTSTLNTIELENKQTQALINITQNSIYKGKLRLQNLNSEIQVNVQNVEDLHSILRDMYQKSNEAELKGDFFSFLVSDSFFSVGQKVEEEQRITIALHEHTKDLRDETERLYKNRNFIQQQRIDLERNEKQLTDRKKIYQQSLSKQKELVKDTENDEIRYQKLLLERLSERLQLQEEIIDYESKIEFKQDPDNVPKPRSGVLAWPVAGKVKISQNFGRTPFAIRNRRHYGRPFHDGIDLSIPIGTPIYASSSGKIVGIGNTDLLASCQSWGKWVLIEHENGLSTLYAHLSLIKVRLGQTVALKELIGYSGNTGFSTGPHLHFGVYDSKGVRVVPYEQVSRSARCRGLQVIAAAQESKINPIVYLPNR